MPAPPQFVNRRKELEALKRARSRKGANFVVVTGRRRVGKTELLARFCAGKPSAMIFVRESGAAAQAMAVGRELAGALGDTVVAENPPADIDGLLELAGRFLERPGRPILVLDEFQNLAAGRREVLSALQRFWDLRLRGTEGTLVLCGSAVGMMEEFVLSPGSPLYGRSTLRVEVRPLAFWDCGGLLPERNLRARLLRFAVAGGVPYYLQVLAREPDLRRALFSEVFARTGLLYDEPAVMIRAETREPDRYFTLLEAIAGGVSRVTEIADRTALPVTQVTAYLKILTDGLRLVDRRVPVTERRPGAKAGLYRVSDPFNRFWFACVAPWKSALESGGAAPAVGAAVERLPSLAGPVLEDVVRDAMGASLGESWRGLRLDFTSIGSWWSRSGDEIDVVAIGGKGGPIAAEVTLGGRPVGLSEVDRLVAKSELLPLRGPVRLAVITAGGFTTGAVERAEETGVTLIGGRDLAAIFRKLGGG